VQVVLAREPTDRDGYRIALITTDSDATPEQLLARYHERWSIERCFQDAKHLVGVGQARNRRQAAVERTVPFGFLCQTLLVVWYALHGRPDQDVKARRRAAPWYRDKRAPSTLDMLAALRRELTRAEFHPQAARRRTPQQTTHTALPPAPPRREITKVEF